MNSLATADIICWNGNHPLRKACQYSFPTLCSTLSSKNSKYTIYNKYNSDDVSLCTRICEEMIKKR